MQEFRQHLDLDYVSHGWYSALPISNPCFASPISSANEGTQSAVLG